MRISHGVKNKSIYILGAGNMARETLGIYKSLRKLEAVHGFIEQNCRRKNQKIQGKKIIDASQLKYLSKKSLLIAAIGLPLKKQWIENLEANHFKFDTVIHPSVIIGDSVKIGRGCIIGAGVILTQNIKIGRHAIVNINSTISHDCIIGDYVTICPGVNIAGNVQIEEGSWIGIGATLIQKVKIGTNSLIGAGAVVTRDIPPHTIACGVPAKSIGKIKKSDWAKIL